MYAVLQILKQNGGQMPVGNILAQIPNLITIPEEEQKSGKSGLPKWQVALRFTAMGYKKAGYIKNNKGWALTPKAEAALLANKTKDEIQLDVERLYAQWKENRDKNTSSTASNTTQAPPVELINTTQTSQDFLSEVYMAEESLNDLKNLLEIKKNVILQGAPGVGKTFSAKRLAYVMMGAKDDSRIKIIQFHQNYSYEDFIMGYKPNATGGFELKDGVFYDFCKKAAQDPDNKYFFIIDEINRGNMSKIFGELLQLIEVDYRNHPIKLAYNNQDFAVPANVYIIGMMNTADRSLAMIDYALRRRFSFFTMAPAFELDSFKQHLNAINDPKLNQLIDKVIELNKAIKNDSSLGEGFVIGHSYFCHDTLDLRTIVRYEILPTLREYWFDNEDNIQKWEKELLDAIK